jgi:hypothetical protein
MEHDQERQRLNIVRLPAEILRAIFAYFERTGNALPDQLSALSIKDRLNLRDEGRACRTTVCNARLVCRLFNELASPFLVPALHIHLDQASLDRAEAVSQNRLVASGVRSVDVILRYRAAERAGSLEYFTHCALGRLDGIEANIEMMLDLVDGGALPVEEHEDYEQWHEVMNMDIIGHIRRAWTHNDSAQSPNTDLPRNEEYPSTEDYRRVLADAYKEYCLRHAEQTRLITGGSFVNNLAVTVARLPQAASLALVDEAYNGWDDWGDWDGCITRPKYLLTHLNEFFRYLSSPDSWQQIHQIDGPPHPPEILPTRILSELPIAIHKAGTQLRGLRICVLPVTHLQDLTPLEANLSDGTEMPDREDLSGGPVPLWDDLRAACLNLDTLHIDANTEVCGCPTSGGTLVEGSGVNDMDALDCLGTFLSCLVSSPGLKDLRVELDGYSLLHYNKSSYDNYELDTFLGAVPNLPLIRSVALCSVRATPKQFAKFCRGLGVGSLESIELKKVQILDDDVDWEDENTQKTIDGGWEMITDILKERSAALCGNGGFALDGPELTKPSEKGVATWLAGLAKARLEGFEL